MEIPVINCIVGMLLTCPIIDQRIRGVQALNVAIAFQPVTGIQSEKRNELSGNSDFQI